MQAIFYGGDDRIVTAIVTAKKNSGDDISSLLIFRLAVPIVTVQR